MSGRFGLLWDVFRAAHDGDAERTEFSSCRLADEIIPETGDGIAEAARSLHHKASEGFDVIWDHAKLLPLARAHAADPFDTEKRMAHVREFGRQIAGHALACVKGEAKAVLAFCGIADVVQNMDGKQFQSEFRSVVIHAVRREQVVEPKRPKEDENAPVVWSNIADRTIGEAITGTTPQRSQIMFAGNQMTDEQVCARYEIDAEAKHRITRSDTVALVSMLVFGPSQIKTAILEVETSWLLAKALSHSRAGKGTCP